MSSIAYITDSKMLEMHRLNAHKTMNFWRLSNKTNFSDFNKGDLVFFLSKDKQHQLKKEKGIVGYGRLKEIYLTSVKNMWKKFGKENGFNTYEEFEESLIKLSKDNKLPNKISSFYLENVSFFQAPIYLSECGMKISNNVESYIYLKPDDVTLKILEFAKSSPDLWSNSDTSNIEIDELRYRLALTHKTIGDYKLNDKLSKRTNRVLRKFIKENDYEFIPGSNQELFRIIGNKLEILLYNDKEVEKRLLIGQAILYMHYLNDVDIDFKFLNDDTNLVSLINKP